MSVNVLGPSLVGLLPVLSFLAVLLYLDSYKLVKLRDIIVVVAFGAAIAGASYLINAQIAGLVEIEFKTLSRYVAPVSEEVAVTSKRCSLAHSGRPTMSTGAWGG